MVLATRANGNGYCFRAMIKNEWDVYNASPSRSCRCVNPSLPKKQGRKSGDYFEELVEKMGRKVRVIRH